MAISRKKYEEAVAKTRARRMKWWNEARYGMFVHWGLYAQVGRNEWVWAIENIPREQYECLARTFKPKPRPAREWARLACKSGIKYMVMTTKHHEDGAKCAHDEAARRRFIDFTHGCVRELMSNYGKIDILWYDVSQPLRSPAAWESVRMGSMARELQPHILINNRAQIPEDFSTPEENVKPEASGRGWEACMTFNHASWGYMPSAAHDADPVHADIQAGQAHVAGVASQGPGPTRGDHGHQARVRRQAQSGLCLGQ